MKKQLFRVDSDGFNGAWYPAPAESKRGMIIMLGDRPGSTLTGDLKKFWLNGNKASQTELVKGSLVK